MHLHVRPHSPLYECWYLIALLLELATLLPEDARLQSNATLLLRMCVESIQTHGIAAGTSCALPLTSRKLPFSARSLLDASECMHAYTYVELHTHWPDHTVYISLGWLLYVATLTQRVQAHTSVKSSMILLLFAV